MQRWREEFRELQEEEDKNPAATGTVMVVACVWHMCGTLPDLGCDGATWHVRCDIGHAPGGSQAESLTPDLWQSARAIASDITATSIVQWFLVSRVRPTRSTTKPKVLGQNLNKIKSQCWLLVCLPFPSL